MRSTRMSLLGPGGRLADPGDQQAWQDFVRQYRPRLLAWCRSKGRQDADAEDLVQDVLAKVIRLIRGGRFVYNPSRNFSGWLRTIWWTALSDAVRALPPGATGGGDSSLLADLEDGHVPAELEAEFERELLHEAMARTELLVSERDWRIFTDVAITGRSLSEVAAEHQLTAAAAGMVKLRVQRKISQVLVSLQGKAEREES